MEMRKLSSGLGLAVGLAAALSVLPIAGQASAIRLDAGFGGNTLAPNDDGSTGLVNLGFQIDFFGNMHTQAYVNNNGNITFDTSLSTFTPFPLLTTNREILAPFFGDVDTNDAGQPVTYGQSTIGGQAAFGVNWLDVDYFNSSTSHTNRNSFQLVMVDRSDIGTGDFDFEFNYSGIQWEAGTASDADNNGRGGFCARAGWSNGSTAAYELAGSAICGAFLDGTGLPVPPIGANALPFNELNSILAIDADNQQTTGRYLFQVRNGEVVPPPSGDVPVPGTLLLLALGLVGLSRRLTALA